MASSFSNDQIVNLIKSLSGKREHSHFSFGGIRPTKSEPPFTRTKHGDERIFTFPAKWSVSDWYSDDKYGDCKIDKLNEGTKLFPSLKVLGTGDVATVNKAFYDRFYEILPKLMPEVKEIVEKKKKIVFTGHSSGGAIAILATTWFLEQYRHSEITPLCITYGAPLVGDKVFGHAVRRELLLHGIYRQSWASCFINVVSTRDFAPRILLSPRHDLLTCLQSIFESWEKKKILVKDELFEDFFTNLVNNAFSTASYDSCVLRNCASGSSLLEAVNGIVELSPYRPFGSFYFCIGNGNLLRVDNQDAVLQILFYSLQLVEHGGRTVCQFVKESILEHLNYENSVKELNNNAIAHLTALKEVPLLSQGAPANVVDSALQLLGLSAEARLSLRAAGEVEALRLKNLETVKGYKEIIGKELDELEKYRAASAQAVGYYDAFKQHEHECDFKANVTRLELVGHWEDVREMLKDFALPDSFEMDREWVELGTKIRLLMEPIDIANFYRHAKKDATGLYETTSPARPKYYKYPENWLKHIRSFVPKTDPVIWDKAWNLDSCFWARVENMCIKHELAKDFAGIENLVLAFEKEVSGWLENGALEEAVLIKSPTFKKWWNMLPDSHRNKTDPDVSRIRDIMNKAPAA